MFFAEGFPGVDADGGVGVGDVAVAIPNGVHFVQGFSVGGAVTPDFLADVLDAVATEVEEAWEIVGIADVHGVGIGSDGRARLVLAGEEIARDDVVGVGGGDEAGYGNADTFRENARGEITEIAAGDGDHERHRGNRQLAIRGHVIEHLRKQAADVDGVCGREEGTLVELLVGESLLDEALAIVEGARDFEGGNVLTESGELLFLRFANAFGRIENDDADSGDSEESVGDGAAGITRGGDENGELTRFAANEIAHKASHETRAEIFEGQRGAMEEFEDVQRGREGDEFDGEVDGFGDDLPEDFLGDIGCGEWAHETEADFGKGKLAKLVEFFGTVPGNLRGHVQAAVRGEASEYGASERGEGSFAGSAAIAHEVIGGFRVGRRPVPGRPGLRLRRWPSRRETARATAKSES
jgi:hypothetical protein